MPKRSKIETLPAKVREQLEKILVQSGFSGYRELETWCAEQGIKVSKSALQRFGANFEDRVKAIKVATDQARAVVDASPDDDNAMNDALIRLVQERVFALLVESNSGDLPASVLAKVTKSIADVGRASVQQKKFSIEFRDRILKKLDEKADEAVKGGDKTKAELYREIREDIYGVAA